MSNTPTQAFQVISPDKIPAYQKYLSYSDDEQKVLQVFAVLHRPINQTNMAKLLRQLYAQYKIGPLDKIMAKSFREKALRDEVLISKSGSLSCHKDIYSLLVMETIKNGLFKSIKTSTETQVPYFKKTDWFAYNNLEKEYDDIRAVQNALFSQDDKKLLLAIDDKAYPYPLDNNNLSLFQRYASPYYLNIFSHFTPLARYFILANCLKYLNSEEIQQNTAIELLQQLVRDMEHDLAKPKSLPPAAPRYLLAEQFIMRGDFNAFEGLISESDTTSNILALRAQSKTMLGQYEEAIGLYQQTQVAIKKETRKRKIIIPGIPGVFYILALLAKNQTSFNLLAQQQLDSISINSEESSCELLQEFLSILLGKGDEKEAILLRYQQHDAVPIYILLWSLCRIWLGNKLSPSWLTTLQLASFNARDAGHKWYYLETQVILNKIDKNLVDKELIEKSAHGNEPNEILVELITWQPLIDLVRPIPQWQRVLNSIQTLNQNDNAIAESLPELQSVKTNRMTWRVYFSGSACELEAREQVFGKSKKWSAGRVVSLERLYTETGSFDYLTEQDKKICQHIEVETTYEYYGRYAKNHFYAMGLPLLRAAIGHPLLFLGEDPKQALDLSSAEVVLEVQSSPKNINLKLSPYPSGKENYAVLRESNNRIKLVELNAQHQHLAEILGERGVSVPLQAKQQVIDTISSIAPLLTIHSDIASHAQLEAKAVDANPHPQIHIQPSTDGLLFECYVQPFSSNEDDLGPLFHPGHGHTIIMSEINAQALQTSRDLKLETQLAGLIMKQCPLLNEHSGWHWEIDVTEDALDTLLQLQSLGDSISLRWPQGEKLKLKKQQQLKQMQVNIRKKHDWFELDGQLKLDDGQTIAMQDLFQLMQATPGRFIKLNDGEFLALTEELKSRLSDLQFMGAQGHIHALAVPLVDELTDGMQIKSGKHWQTILQKAEQAKNFQPELPSTLQAQLRDYQLEGFQWLARLAHWGAGACLADDMGLGKTLQALALILSRTAQGPTLVIAPTSVCTNWIDESYRFAPTLQVKQFGQGDREKMLAQADAFDLIVCSYGLLQSQAKQLSQVKWHTIVADEAQAFKNSQTKRSQAMMELQGDFKLIMSGTPIENHLGELWNLYRFINPGLLGSIENYNQQFASPIENNKDKAAGKRLKNLIKPFILRRLKTDVLTELPPRTEITIHVELSKEETALYEALRQQAIEKLSETQDQPGQARIKMLAEIMRLRRVCCNPRLVMPEVEFPSSKLQAFGNIVEELRENKHKALVFSQFVGHLSIIREFLDAQQISYQYLDGSTPAKKRKEAVNAFQAGEGEIFLISLKAGGSGLNLTAADYVIHMDPWWNPAVEDQASDRAHRIGQTRPVTIYRLVSQGTIESKIVQLHQQKRELADNLLEGSEMSGKMSVDDMFALIRENGTEIIDN